ncbi:SDR family NAD(P)-dependent oxidoreductase [Spiroplasma phoeniceum]|uniref:Short-chain dehydrogenase/reductase n=1 Tax=Spiroplasma phoeniceum P40 TaxID=1276259 RepID=A0A345DQQ8_9MOLU|nr:SDR family NAD(P)-dependent oxidoreductase [Spiroplasma phoeniceum]AXF96549.1 putative short-chain dehydrogenase/reductase [Spiroplasma phoeniceum P40]
MEKEFVVVTGASSGIGYGYCQWLLKQGYHIIGVSRHTEWAKELQQQFPEQTIVALSYDLSVPENCYALFEKIKQYHIVLFINNAGFGKKGLFITIPLADELKMINLNIQAVHILTKLFTQYFIEQKKGRIINISSLSAFFPGPGMATYYATKAYILSLSVAINTELKKTKSPVRVVTICPGATQTAFFKNSDFKNNKTLPGLMSLERFIKKSLPKALRIKRKNYLIIGWKNRSLKRLFRIIPQKSTLNYTYLIQTKD